MMKVSCKDLGADCDFVAMGETKDEVVKKMMDHGMSEHKAMMEGMSATEKDEMVKKMMSKMVTT